MRELARLDPRKPSEVTDIPWNIFPNSVQMLTLINRHLQPLHLDVH
jgi:hypothetical protein